MRGWDTTLSATPRRRSWWRLALLAPRFFPGAALHRIALAAGAAGDADVADRLFEVAAGRYRDELQVEPLARLRVHQLMHRAAADTLEIESALEVERRLLRLRRIESPAPPFRMVSASSLVGVWPAQIQGSLPADPTHARLAA